jgi:hypothetical protein
VPRGCVLGFLSPRPRAADPWPERGSQLGSQPRR